MSNYILPIIFILLFIFCIFKKVNVYDTFIKGAKGAIKLVVDIFPFIAAIMIAVALLRVSGIPLGLQGCALLSSTFLACRLNYANLSFCALLPEVEVMRFLKISSPPMARIRIFQGARA